MKKLVWILLSLIVIGGAGAYFLGKDNITAIEVATSKGIKATVFRNNIYQKGYVQYDFDSQILYVNTEYLDLLL